VSEEGNEGERIRGRGSATEVGVNPADERLSALTKIFLTDELLDVDNFPGPLHWPNLTVDEATREWPALRFWVDRLRMRFPHLDHHVIPRCWFLHNGHVEALAALRDQERVNYAETAPGTAGVDWHRAFRDIEIRLREWTGQLACGATHEPSTCQAHPTTAGEWDVFIHEDAERRSGQAIDDALSEE
jgi:hypothetical protein